MRIGEVARACGVSVDTVRYYERLGLVSSSHRTSGGFREFAADAVARINDVRALQACGITLVEAAQLLGTGAYTCVQAEDALGQVVSRIDAAIAQLAIVRSNAVTARARCLGTACAHAADEALSCC